MSVSAAIETFVNNIDASAAAYLDSCVHCGQCAQACHFYETTGDVRYTPVWKLEPMRRVYKRHKAPLSGIKKMFGLVPDEVDEDMLKEWEELIYDSCTLCGRCTIVCPMGIDIAGLVRKSREAMVAAGLVPEGLNAAAKRVLEIGRPLGIKPEIMAKIVGEQAEEVGIPIELNKVGVDYMIILSAMEVLNFYEVIGALARIFKQAGVTWTISTEAYEATNVGIQMGDKEIARTLVQRIVDAAEKLQVKYVVSPECGHAYSALNWEGPNLVGKNYDFEVIHILELLDQLVREGRIKTKSELDQRRVTFHDPCQIVRRGGIVDEPRNLLHMVSDNFIEMENYGVANICCGGGGGVSSNSRAEELRIKSFGAKKKQLDAVGPEALVTACGNCRNVLEEAIDEFGMDLPVLGLTELVAEYLDD
ncbi:MAG: (Fe-S)-binding protein [Rhodospirillaceae bacterium]|jgi:Fe-S oxidoreductase|nr:(Fe-S)-binding protein [Rhodospirillaceae bacterium]MBT5242717.1 (Fe-S)-binding protein [Rhodospirillaceae bacterium]MBT5561530.1 (Fe-S)-binding protein [Rhodospirillaceae bacterium]MBT6241872.1 (Fe-S)-binding protein [Rhodospirillaceae bacterium]MBT7138673.1 (Fe-S)-binding protein [Rhodospirillaceae bacterium]